MIYYQKYCMKTLAILVEKIAPQKNLSHNA